eukprot:CAMPEP_0171768080 /NCGR_PEP_ID=MMETSP0991-20121206/52193_1 /TAXON_ID=483369 /ORGANISM="non described non described, Strain CCMP2098" /LENGTH=327 /DNA_ID=CAMNT_0012372975 /DNA_START=41 /DNA_END=1020 /DNA_ORIENTATION=+
MGLVGTVILHAVGALLIALDFLLYCLLLGPIRTAYSFLTSRRVFAKVHSQVDINGEGMPPSNVWRSVEALAQGHLTTSPDGVSTTAYEGLCAAYKKCASAKAQGSRPLLRWQKDDGFRFEAKVFGETQWRSYGELGELAHAFGCALRKCGLEPQPSSDDVDHNGVLIYDETSADWMVCMQGAMSQDVVVATAYATLGMDAVVKAVKQGAVNAIVCNRKAVPNVLKFVKDMPSLKLIVYTDALCTPEESAERLTAPAFKGSLLSFNAIVCNRKAVPNVLKFVKDMPSLKLIVYTDALCTPEESAERLTAPAFKGSLLSFNAIVCNRKA